MIPKLLNDPLLAPAISDMREPIPTEKPREVLEEVREVCHVASISPNIAWLNHLKNHLMG